MNPNHVYVTGLGKYGQLGLGDLEKRMEFTHVEFFEDRNISYVFGGGHHSWFLVNSENPRVEMYEPPSPPVELEMRNDNGFRIPTYKNPKYNAQSKYFTKNRS